ncbi:hypothetical protein [Metabacillus endolithicus]|uniref:YfhD family protein n=1 Tax=Metabacillus endolithicus TaxID=1535204 RepID=A0ABW5C544_9BACI|nr:hypothetical protein [Metabacillus endolithicus]UPG65209.1 hypothetical protein MVE64_09595 [Metabacillus endolithicus]
MEGEVQSGTQFANPMAVHEDAYRNYVNEAELSREIKKLKNEKESV